MSVKPGEEKVAPLTSRRGRPTAVPAQRAGISAVSHANLRTAGKNDRSELGEGGSLA